MEKNVVNLGIEEPEGSLVRKKSPWEDEDHIVKHLKC
jgi:hypothetical protein